MSSPENNHSLRKLVSSLDTGFENNLHSKYRVMKKIILAFDGVHFSEGAFEFAKRINEEEPILLTGIFLPQANYANLWSFAKARTEPLYVPLVEADETEV